MENELIKISKSVNLINDSQKNLTIFIEKENKLIFENEEFGQKTEVLFCYKDENNRKYFKFSTINENKKEESVIVEIDEKILLEKNIKTGVIFIKFYEKMKEDELIKYKEEVYNIINNIESFTLNRIKNIISSEYKNRNKRYIESYFGREILKEK